jgi:DNA-binding transcriptional regulator YiaG
MSHDIHQRGGTLRPSQCKEARLKLDLSAAQMARVLGLADGRSVRRFEAPRSATTARAPDGPLARLYELILADAIDHAALTLYVKPSHQRGEADKLHPTPQGVLSNPPTNSSHSV